MEPDKMGNHSNYNGVAVFQIGFDEKGRVTGADAISGKPLGISHLMAAVSRWNFKPVVVNGMKKGGCGKLWIKICYERKHAVSRGAEPAIARQETIRTRFKGFERCRDVSQMFRFAHLALGRGET
jgi:hypothetical protein